MKAKLFWLGFWTGNKAENVRLIEVLICLRKGMSRNETCNSYFDRNKRWAEKNRERDKKKHDEQKEEKKEYNKEYAMRETDCLTCGCRV